MRQPDKASESRLDAMRERAAQDGVAGAGVTATGGPIPVAAWRPQTTPASQGSDTSGYYGLPLLKAPVWTWEVPLYFFIGGLAGGSALLALASQLMRGGAALQSAALWVALGSALVCPLLLIADLGRPERFLNMLRVFKFQSPMSVGAWTLAGFSGALVVSVGANEALRAGLILGWLFGLRFMAEVVAAATGIVLLSYTAVLLGATAIPVWSENRKLLGSHFVASGIGSASAALEFLGFLLPAMQWIGIAASAWETVVGILLELRPGRVNRPLRHGRSGWAARTGGMLAGPVALLLRVFYGASSVGGREVAATCFVAGALLTRYAWVWAGRASAGDAQALFEVQRHRHSLSRVPPP